MSGRIALGESRLEVSRFAFGCEQLGGVDWGEYAVEKVEAALVAAADRGIDFFDTADVYGLGRSETRLANALGDRKKSVTIATKCGVRWETGEGSRARTWKDSSPEWIVQAVDASRSRLGLDVLPFLWLHWTDDTTPIEASLECFEGLRARGAIREFGICNLKGSLLDRALACSRPAAYQGSYNWIDRAAEDDVLPALRDRGVPFFAYGALSQGLLSGKFGFDRPIAETDRRSRLPRFQPENRAATQSAVTRFLAEAEGAGQSPARYAHRWILDRPGIGGVIAGVKNVGQLLDSLG